jgi:hypothetical protein
LGAIARGIFAAAIRTSSGNSRQPVPPRDHLHVHARRFHGPQDLGDLRFRGAAPPRANDRDDDRVAHLRAVARGRRDRKRHTVLRVERNDETALRGELEDAEQNVLGNDGGAFDGTARRPARSHRSLLAHLYSWIRTLRGSGC